MSSSKFDTSGAFQPVTVHGHETQLSLPPHAVRISKNGVEFLSDQSIPLWKELTITLSSPADHKRINCAGVVVGCSGNRHSGYVISIMFTHLSRQAEQRLSDPTWTRA